MSNNDGENNQTTDQMFHKYIRRLTTAGLTRLHWSRTLQCHIRNLHRTGFQWEYADVPHVGMVPPSGGTWAPGQSTWTSVHRRCTISRQRCWQFSLTYLRQCITPLWTACTISHFQLIIEHAFEYYAPASFYHLSNCQLQRVELFQLLKLRCGMHCQTVLFQHHP